jgi:adenylate cyclase
MTTERSLATVLFTDIVGSTERATELGDRAWRTLLEEHNAQVRRELRRFGGRELSTAGDSFLALFERPARAIACADAIRSTVRTAGLEVRCGVHMGEVEVMEKTVGGIGVHIAARVMAEAGHGEVLVSRSVHDAVEGSGFGFEDRGARTLKGVTGQWQLFAVTSVPVESIEAEQTRWTLRPLLRRPVLAGSAAGVILVLAGLAIALVGRGGGESVEAPIGSSPPAAAPPVEHASVAVLPFVNVSGDPEQEYFSDGLTEELLTALAQVPGLRVAARTSSFAFKDKDVPVDEIGERLRVAHVLEGSVRRSGERLRITAQLVDAENGYHLWSESYDRELADVFAIQEEIARAIVDALELTLAGAGTVVQPGTTDLEAYGLYLQGRFYANRFTESDLRRALDLYRQAVEKDPSYADAYAAIAESWTWLADDWVAPREAYPRSKEAARRALELDPDLASGHNWIGGVYWNYDWNFDGAEREYRRAIELNPNDAEAIAYLALLLAIRGRRDEAVVFTERAAALDPVSWVFGTRNARVYLILHRYEDAIREARRTLEIYPGSSLAHRWLGDALLAQEKAEEALATYRRGLATAPGYVRLRNGEARALAALGRPDEARRIAEALEEEAERHYVRAEEIAGIWAALGNRDRAFRWLDRAYEERSAGMPFLAYPMYDPLRSDPRFAVLERKIGLR